MVIYRIENAAGKGPYFGEPTDWCETFHCEMNGQPGPNDDQGIKGFWNSSPAHKQYRFGFESMAQLNTWFTPKELKALKRLGYKIVKIKETDCAKVVRGDKQVIFKLKAA